LSSENREELTRLLDFGKDLLEKVKDADATTKDALMGALRGYLPTLTQELERQSNQGKPANALTLALLMLALGRAFDHLPTKGKAFKILGKVYLQLEQYKEVLESYEQAQTIMRELEDELGEIDVLSGMEEFYSVLAQRQRKLKYYEESVALFKRALGIAKQLGHRQSECVYLYSMGDNYLFLDRKEESLASLEQALDLAKRLGNRHLEGRILNELGKTYRALGRLEPALESLKAAQEISQEVGDQTLERDILVETGITLTHAGQFPAALDHLQRGFKVCQQLDDPIGGSATLHRVSLVYDQLGQFEDALECTQQALEVLQVTEDKTLESDILHTRGLLYGRLWRFEEALPSLEKALTIRRELGDRQRESRTLTQIGETYRLMKKPKDAFKVLEQAIKMDPESYFCWLYMGRCLEDLGRREEAITSYRRVLRINPENRFARERIQRLGILL
jgi:tetratricopeptide (TPR) repeat protein